MSAFTDNMQTFLELGDEAEAQVLTLDFGTTSTTPPPEPAARQLPSRDDVPNIRRPWTFDETELVLAGRKLGLSNDDIGNKLGRTGRAVEAVVTQLRREGRL